MAGLHGQKFEQLQPFPQQCQRLETAQQSLQNPMRKPFQLMMGHSAKHKSSVRLKSRHFQTCEPQNSGLWCTLPGSYEESRRQGLKEMGAGWWGGDFRMTARPLGMMLHRPHWAGCTWPGVWGQASDSTKTNKQKKETKCI